MGQGQVFSTYTGASRQGLSHSDLGLIQLPFPNIARQRELVRTIEEHDKTYKSIHACIKSQIATLNAYRKSLIHECVMGQRRITDADLNRVKAHG